MGPTGLSPYSITTPALFPENTQTNSTPSHVEEPPAPAIEPAEPAGELTGEKKIPLQTYLNFVVDWANEKERSGEQAFKFFETKLRALLTAARSLPPNYNFRCLTELFSNRLSAYGGDIALQNLVDKDLSLTAWQQSLESFLCHIPLDQPGSPEYKLAENYMEIALSTRALTSNQRQILLKLASDLKNPSSRFLEAQLLQELKEFSLNPSNTDAHFRLIEDVDKLSDGCSLESLHLLRKAVRKLIKDNVHADTQTRIDLYAKIIHMISDRSGKSCPLDCEDLDLFNQILDCNDSAASYKTNQLVAGIYMYCRANDEGFFNKEHELAKGLQAILLRAYRIHQEMPPCAESEDSLKEGFEYFFLYSFNRLITTGVNIDELFPSDAETTKPKGKKKGKKKIKAYPRAERFVEGLATSSQHTEILYERHRLLYRLSSSSKTLKDKIDELSLKTWTTGVNDESLRKQGFNYGKELISSFIEIRDEKRNKIASEYLSYFTEVEKLLQTASVQDALNERKASYEATEALLDASLKINEASLLKRAYALVGNSTSDFTVESVNAWLVDFYIFLTSPQASLESKAHCAKHYFEIGNKNNGVIQLLYRVYAVVLLDQLININPNINLYLWATYCKHRWSDSSLPDDDLKLSISALLNRQYANRLTLETAVFSSIVETIPFSRVDIKELCERMEGETNPKVWEAVLRSSINEYEKSPTHKGMRPDSIICLFLEHLKTTIKEGNLKNGETYSLNLLWCRLLSKVPAENLAAFLNIDEIYTHMHETLAHTSKDTDIDAYGIPELLRNVPPLQGQALKKIEKTGLPALLLSFLGGAHDIKDILRKVTTPETFEHLTTVQGKKSASGSFPHWLACRIDELQQEKSGKTERMEELRATAAHPEGPIESLLAAAKRSAEIKYVELCLKNNQIALDRLQAQSKKPSSESLKSKKNHILKQECEAVLREKTAFDAEANRDYEIKLDALNQQEEFLKRLHQQITETEQRIVDKCSTLEENLQGALQASIRLVRHEKELFAKKMQALFEQALTQNMNGPLNRDSEKSLADIRQKTERSIAELGGRLLSTSRCSLLSPDPQELLNENRLLKRQVKQNQTREDELQSTILALKEENERLKAQRVQMEAKIRLSDAIQARGSLDVMKFEDLALYIEEKAAKLETVDPQKSKSLTKMVQQCRASKSKSDFVALMDSAGFQELAPKGTSHFQYRYFLPDGTMLEGAGYTIAEHGDVLKVEIREEVLRRVAHVLKYLIG